METPATFNVFPIDLDLPYQTFQRFQHFPCILFRYLYTFSIVTPFLPDLRPVSYVYRSSFLLRFSVLRPRFVLFVFCSARSIRFPFWPSYFSYVRKNALRYLLSCYPVFPFRLVMSFPFSRQLLKFDRCRKPGRNVQIGSAHDGACFNEQSQRFCPFTLMPFASSCSVHAGTSFTKRFTFCTAYLPPCAYIDSAVPRFVSTRRYFFRIYLYSLHNIKGGIALMVHR